MFQRLLQLLKRVRWDVGMGVQAHVMEVVPVRVRGHVTTPVRDHVHTDVKVADIHVQVHAKAVAQGHADIRVLVNNL